MWVDSCYRLTALISFVWPRPRVSNLLDHPTLTTVKLRSTGIYIYMTWFGYCDTPMPGFSPEQTDSITATWKKRKRDHEETVTLARP